MKLLVTLALLLVSAFLIGGLMAAAFEPPISFILSGIFGVIYGWFGLGPMLKWSFEK